MSDTPRTDDIWYDPSRKYNGQLASSLYDLCRELERENTALRADKERLDWLGKVFFTTRAAIDAAMKETTK